MGESHLKNGGRRVELFAPFKTSGRLIEAIEIAPIKLDHVIRWDERKFPNQIALLAELTGLPEISLRQMTYPDVDRVLTAFWGMLPPAILNNLNLVGSSSVSPNDVGETFEGEAVNAPPPPASNVVSMEEDDGRQRTGFAVG